MNGSITGSKGEPDEAARYTPEMWHETRGEVDRGAGPHFRHGRESLAGRAGVAAGARTLYADVLGERRGANSLGGDGALDWKQAKTRSRDQFTYDPRNPVPTRGRRGVLRSQDLSLGDPWTRGRWKSARTCWCIPAPPLKRDLEVTGPIRVVLYAATSAPDTDFTAKLVDVSPNGEARNLTDGILRIRYRAGLDEAELARPGEIYRLKIDAGVTSNVFLRGHAIRVEISSSNFPRFDRNPNTGRAFADETVLKKAQQLVYHSRQYPSYVLLPVIPESEIEARELKSQALHRPAQ